MPHFGHRLMDLDPDERVRELQPKACPPLHTATAAIGYAIERFHASWAPYRTITPTLYAIAPTARGAYVTLGRLRSRFRLDWDLVEAAMDVLETRYAASGYLVAAPAVGGEPLRALFGLQGHELGERHYGALDLRTLQPFEASFETELDLPREEWDARWQEAVSNSGIARHAVSR